MSAEEEKKEETPVFSFKEIPAETDNSSDFSDVVILKEEKVDPEGEKKPDVQDEGEKEKGEQKETTESKKTPEQQEKKEDVEKEEEEEEEVVDLNDELAFKYLKENKGLQFDSLEDFLKSKDQKKLDPEVEKYLEYKEKTGRGYSDFLETQKEWAKESPEVLIKAVIKLNNPSLTSDEVDFLFDRDFGYDEEIDDESDVREKKINQKIESKKALAFLEKQKEEYTVPRGSDDSNIPEEYIEAKDLIDKLYDESVEKEQRATISREDFVSKTKDVLNDKFEGFEFTIEGQSFKLKPDNIKETREAQLDIANFQKKFFDKGEKLADSKGYHKALYAAMNADKFAEHFYNLGKTSYAEELEKKSKNIDVKGDKHLPSPSVLEGFTFKKA